jgi:hypothetical protein
MISARDGIRNSVRAMTSEHADMGGMPKKEGRQSVFMLVVQGLLCCPKNDVRGTMTSELKDTRAVLPERERQ